jgi:uncharacterized protein YciI
MLFAIQCTDRADGRAIRAATRPAHLAHLEAHQDRLLLVGPVLDAEGLPCGSLLVVEATDQAAAEAFAAADPYARAGLFESVTVQPFRTVFKDGKRAG